MSRSAQVKIGSVIQCPSGESNKTILPCQNMLHEIQDHSDSEGCIEPIYGKVDLDQSPWGREAGMVYERCLKEHNPIPEIHDDNNLQQNHNTVLSRNLSTFSDMSSTLSSLSLSDRRSHLSSKSSINVSDQRSMRDRNFPVVISHGSSSRDDMRSKPMDEGYHASSLRSLHQPQKRSLSCQTKDNDQRYYVGSSFHSYGQPEQSKKQSLRILSGSSMRSEQRNKSDETCQSIRKGHSSTGGSVRSEENDDHCIVSTSDHKELNTAYAKHQMMVTLKEASHATSDPQGQPNIRTHVEPNSRSSNSHPNSWKVANGSKEASKGKRAIRDREPSPNESSDNDGNSGKRRRGNSSGGKGSGPDPQYACPFHKRDPQRYSPNPETGVKFRSCLGPGFSSISKLKQHLRRVHSAPIQCQRCWLTMKSVEEMGRHVNTEVRCEMGTARPKEGISQEVMSRISGSHGVNWEGIFRLLFPGAPIPSPYYEPDLAESIRQSSPQSEDLRRYEAYNRDALPFLVDASLRCAVNARNEPITEEMRTLVVNIVRNCQVASAHNWELRTGSSISTVTLPQAASQRTNAAPETEDEYHESSKARTSKSERSNFVKFPGLDNDTVLPGPENPGHDEDHSSNPVQITNLDLESLFEPCRCSCHHSFGLNSTLGNGFCESCTINHTDMGFSELHNEIDSNSDEMVGRSVMNQIFEWSP